MAKGKRHVQRLPPRSRTRMHKPKLADPDSSVQLAAQLETLGLRLHDTLGDGNCLFRALSDQLYGTEVYHLNLRTEITTWMAKYPERYEGFVEDDRSFEDHLRCMRQPGTYGGHLEISAFAHVKRKNVKVIQPGLVYVIEWDAGAAFPASPSAELAEIRPASPDDEREKRRSKRDKRRTSLDDQHDGEGGAPSIGNTVYIAYHDWEHFSSLRTAAGERPLVAYADPNTNSADDEEPPEEAPPSIPSRSVAPPPPPPPVILPTLTVPTPTPLPPPAKIKRPRGRPRKHPLPVAPAAAAVAAPAPVPSPSPAPAPAPTSLPSHLTPAASAATTPASTLPPSRSPSTVPRSLSPSAISATSTVASTASAGSSSSSSGASTAAHSQSSASTASSSLAPATPVDSQYLVPQNPQSASASASDSPSLLLQSNIASQTPSSAPSTPPLSSSSARTRAYDPSLLRSSPKRHFVDGDGANEDGNGFASEDSETRSAKRAKVKGGGSSARTTPMAAHRSAAAAKSGLNPAVSPPADGSAMGFPLSAGAATESGAKDGTFLPVPLSRASSTTSRSTTTGLDDADPSASASEVDAGPGGSVVSQSTRHEEDDDYDDDEYDDIEDDDYDEEEAVENELVGGLAVGGRVGGPPSPAATLRPSHSPSTFRALDPASTSKSSSSPSPSPSPQKSKSRLHPLPQSHPYTSAKSKAAKSSADGEKALTRRERKKLGLPKPKKAFTPSSAPVSSASTSTTASGTRGPRRVILKVNGQRPGSIRHPDELAAEGAGGEAGGEWAKNGSGRMDVRGFKELKI